MKSKGIWFILIASFAFALMNFTVKYLGDMHPMQIIFFRAFGTSIFISPFMVYNKISFIGSNPKLLLLRSLVGVTSLATFFIAIQRIPLASAISIRYLGPIFGAILAMIFLKEKVKFGQWISFIIAFSGVLVLKGFDIRIDFVSLILCLISAFFIGFVFVLIRYLATKEHHLTIINYFMLFSITVSLLFLPYWRMPISGEWIAVGLIGVFGLVGQVLMTKAFAIEETSVLAPFKYMELVFAFFLALIFFGESYTLISLIGMLLIISGMLINVAIKSREKITTNVR